MNWRNFAYKLTTTQKSTKRKQNVFMTRRFTQRSLGQDKEYSYITQGSSSQQGS
jgi:hypothetical protein